VHDRGSPAAPRTQAARIDTASPQHRRVTSRELLGDHGQLVISHDGREYRLRITQNNKLILTA
jgi:hemin uptake protein HemP